MTIGFGVLGMGTIGGGVFELWHSNRDLICQRSGLQLELIEVADVVKPERLQLDQVRYSTRAEQTISADDVQIVVELIGGTGIALELIRTSLQRGKSVVTANKALIAKHGDSLHELADKNQASLIYEASVGGGIPLLRSLHQGLIANRITAITGTINGTCNYILSRMLNEDLDFSEALTHAQKLGFAESDPRLDIDGLDAAHKITILAGLAFGMPFDMSRCSTEGIQNIAVYDLRLCDRFGYRLMHVSRCQITVDGVAVGVFPALIHKSQILAHVWREMNAALIEADGIGPTFYYGAGAGALPTASAVLSDVVEVAERLSGKQSHNSQRWQTSDPKWIDEKLIDQQQVDGWYLRVTVSGDQIEALHQVFDRHGVEIMDSCCCAPDSGQVLDSEKTTNRTIDYVVLTGNASRTTLNRICQEADLKPGALYPSVTTNE